MTPAMDPTAAPTEIIKHAMLSICKQIQRVLHFGTFLCIMYISTGKNTVNGQKLSEPSNPTTSLKKGNSIEMTVVRITKDVRQMSLNRLSLIGPTENSLAMNLESGHRAMACFSMNAKSGWQKTWYAPIKWITIAALAMSSSQNGL